MCPANYYYLQSQSKCFNYCLNGLLAEDNTSCQNSYLCVDNYNYSYYKKSCMQNQSVCQQQNLSTNLNQCQNCSLVTNIQKCQNNCLNLQYYSETYSQCMAYCGGNQIAYDSKSCQTSTLCIDGFKWSDKYLCQLQQTQDSQTVPKQDDSTISKPNSNSDSQLLIPFIVISNFTVIIIIILVVWFKKTKKEFQEIIQKNSKEIERLDEEMKPLKSNINQQQQLPNNQIEVDNQNNIIQINQIEIKNQQSNQEVEQFDSQQTIKQAQEYFKYQNQNIQ
ncbi:hypothetical protein ABPG72_011666 [Tetrahymena utriculariae]